MLPIAFENCCLYDEIPCLLGCDTGVHPKCTSAVFSLALLWFSVTFYGTIAFVTDNGKTLNYFPSDKDNGMEDCSDDMEMCTGLPTNSLRGHSACISFSWYLNVHVLLLIRG